MPKLNLHDNTKHNHLAYKIGVSASADISFLNPEVIEKAKELGRQIAKYDCVLLTGATTGFPFWTAVGCKEAHGVSVGFSPADSVKEHTEVYRLPADYMDLIIYTGFGYNGRDLLFTRSADAVIIGPGRIGTIHEFAIAYEDGKPLGVLEGGEYWETAEELKMIMQKSHRPNNHVIFEKDPVVLLDKIKRLIDEDRKKLKVYKNDDGVNGSIPNRIL